MAVPVSLQPTFSMGPAARLFSAPILQDHEGDTDRWGISPDRRRFLLLVPAGTNAPLDVVVNWTTLLRATEK